jgi:type II secretory pathway predicted ATPase ExeA
MNRKKFLALYNLKWDPFTQELPSEALYATKKINHFAWRMEQQIFRGGFAMITGELGTGKSVALRILAERFGQMRDVSVGVIDRPQSRVTDFYREMGEIFGVNLSPHNRWGGFKTLRERWKNHVETTLMRPVLLMDEAQEAKSETLCELRLLQSAHFDSTSYLTVVVCGDQRLLDLLRHPALLPLEDRIRVRLNLEYATREELLELLDHALEKAGNRNLLTKEVMETMVDHAGGNIRTLMNTGSELLEAALATEASQIDEKLYLELFGTPPSRSKKTRRVR